MSDMTDSCRLLSLVMQAGINGGPRIPFVVEGAPGTGKTQAIYAIAETISKLRGEPFAAEVWSGPQLNPEDISGLPVPDYENKETALFPLRVGKKVRAAGAGVLIIDEFMSVSEDFEAASLNLLQGGTLGENTLPNSIAIGALGNSPETASNGRALSSPASNRLVWIPWERDDSLWIEYMKGGKGLSSRVEVLPSDWEQNVGILKSRIALCLSKHVSMCHVEPQSARSGKPWPSWRSWENAARLQAAVESCGETPTSKLVYMAVEGCVGKDAADMYLNWMLDIKLPDPEEWLANPQDTEKLLPARPDHRQVAFQSLAMAAQNENRPDYAERWERAMGILAPWFLKEASVALEGCVIMARRRPKGAKLPPEALLMQQKLIECNLFGSNTQTK